MTAIAYRPAAKIFETQTFKDCFSQLFKIPGDQPGPLTHIIREYPLAVGKGGSYYKKKDGTTVPDMSYFIHVLDACIVGGVTFEYYLQKKGRNIPAMNSLVRLFFASLVLHDINKIFEPNSAPSAWRLDEVFDKNEAAMKGILGGYLEPVGRWDDVKGDLKYLILVTEERTWELADLVHTTFDKPMLEDIRKFVKFGDEVSSEADTTDSWHFYKIMVEKTAKLPGIEDMTKVVNFVKLPMVPQTLLRLKFIEILFEELTVNGRRVIFRAPDSLMFIGNPMDDSFMDGLASRFREHVYLSSDNDLIEQLRRYPPTINKVPTGWVKQIGSKMVDGTHPPHDVIRKLLDNYINIHYPKMLLWNGKEWRARNSNIASISYVKWGVETSWVGKDPGMPILKEYKDTESDMDISKKKCMAKLASAKALLRQLGVEEAADKEIENSETLKGVIDGADKSERDSLIALAYAGNFRTDDFSGCQKAYDNILEKLTATMSELYTLEGVDGKKDIMYLLGRDLPDKWNELLDIPDKKDMCIQCGRRGTVGLLSENAFGFPPTGGTGRKLTTLNYNESVNGKLCELCLEENALRRTEFADTQRSKRALAIQIFLGDIITPVDISEIIYALSEEIKETFIVQDFNIKLSNTTKMQLNYHTLGFVRNPSDTSDQFYLLDKLTTLIADTGFKVRLTSMFNGGGIFESTFVWDNAPGWVKELGWNELRLDRIAGLRTEMQYIRSIAKMAHGATISKKIPFVVGARARSPGEVIRVMWEGFIGEKSRRLSPFQIEALYYYARLFSMCTNRVEATGNPAEESEVSELARIAGKMVEKPPESANDHTWMVREAFEVYARGIAEHRNPYDVEKSIAGRLMEIGSRDTSNKEVAVVQGSQDFAKVFMGLIENIGHGRMPKSEVRKDIQAEFALLYHVRKSQKRNE